MAAVGRCGWRSRVPRLSRARAAAVTRVGRPARTGAADSPPAYGSSGGPTDCQMSRGSSQAPGPSRACRRPTRVTRERPGTWERHPHRTVAHQRRCSYGGIDRTGLGSRTVRSRCDTEMKTAQPRRDERSGQAASTAWGDGRQGATATAAARLRRVENSAAM